MTIHIENGELTLLSDGWDPKVSEVLSRQDIETLLNENIVTPIHTLNFSNRKIGNDGVIALAKALKDTLTFVDAIFLVGNDIDDIGVTTLINALENNWSICNIDIVNNTISEHLVLRINNYLARNKKFKVISSQFNNSLEDANLELLASEQDHSNVVQSFSDDDKPGDVTLYIQEHCSAELGSPAITPEEESKLWAELMGTEIPEKADFPSLLTNDSIPPNIQQQWASLKANIHQLDIYGKKLLDKNEPKGGIAIELAARLQTIVDTFLEKHEPATFPDFKEKFEALLNSQNQEMSRYRVNWDTILTNILIALTGIGAVCIAAKLTYSYLADGRATFFGQKAKTTCEEHIADISLEISRLGT